MCLKPKRGCKCPTYVVERNKLVKKAVAMTNAAVKKPPTDDDQPEEKAAILDAYCFAWSRRFHATMNRAAKKAGLTA